MKPPKLTQNCKKKKKKNITQIHSTTSFKQKTKQTLSKHHTFSKNPPIHPFNSSLP